MPNLT
jgi:hypothetical protein